MTDKEIEKVILYWQKTWKPEEEEKQQNDDLPWDAMVSNEAILADRDGLVEQAIELIEQTNRASTSMMQRRLKVGYPRAARLMDELEDLGIVGPSLGGGREREILIGFNDLEE